MKSPIISQNKILSRQNDFGFLTIELMIAFSLMTLFTISIFTLSSSMQRIKIWSLKELDILENAVRKADDVSAVSVATLQYGNDTKYLSIDPFTLAYSDYRAGWGRSTCFPRLSFNQNSLKYFPQGFGLETGNKSTDIEARDGIVYLTADSSTASHGDFFIIDVASSSSPSIVSSLTTGPGLSALEIAGPYAYVAQSSTVAQLQIIDIHTRTSPKVVASLKVPLPTASTTAPLATAIFYSQGFVYLGTAKWAGSEFFIIDVSNPLSPSVVGSFETGTLINDIYVQGTTAYIASSDSGQMRILDVTNKQNPTLLYSFSPSGWQTQEGKVLDYFENNLGLGRTTGGFNVITNHEVFIFSTSTIFSGGSPAPPLSKDVPGGVYGMLIRPQTIFLLTHALLHEFQVWDPTFTTKIFDMSLGVSPVRMTCDRSSLFFATGDSKGFSILTL